MTGSPFLAKNHFSRIISHRIHGTGIMLTYIYHKKIMKKINHPWIGVYTVRPMEILWVLRLSSIEHDGVLYDNAMDLSTGLRWDSFQAIGRDVPPIPTWAPYGNPCVIPILRGYLWVIIPKNPYRTQYIPWVLCEGYTQLSLKSLMLRCQDALFNFDKCIFFFVEGVVLWAGWEWSIRSCHLPRSWNHHHDEFREK